MKYTVITRGALIASALTLTACADNNEPKISSQNHEIVGGTPEVGYPAVGAIVEGSAPFCTATLVRPDIVVTAAHCLADLEGQAIQMYFGPNANDLDTGRVVEVEAYRIHPSYAQDEEADIGIMRLSEPVDITPIPFNSEPLAADLEGQRARFIGFGTWGYNNPEGDGAGIKRSVDVTIREISANWFRYAEDGKGTCHGDSGGPALLDIGGVERLIGVTSWGDENCEEFGVNTRTDTYHAFLDGFIDGGDAGDGGDGGDGGDAGDGGDNLGTCEVELDECLEYAEDEADENLCFNEADACLEGDVEEGPEECNLELDECLEYAEDEADENLCFDEADACLDDEGDVEEPQVCEEEEHEDDANICDEAFTLCLDSAVDEHDLETCELAVDACHIGLAIGEDAPENVDDECFVALDECLSEADDPDTCFVDVDLCLEE